MTSEELIEKFLEIENRNHFFDLKIGNIKIWMYIRFDVYTSLMENYGLFNRNISVDGKFDDRMDIMELIKRMTVKNQFFLRKKEVLIFSFIRKVKENGKYKCGFTDLLAENIDNSYYTFDMMNDGFFYFPRSISGIKNFDISSFKALCSKKDKVVFDGRLLEDKIYCLLEESFENALTTKQKIKINTNLVNILNERSYFRSYYRFILRKIKPKVIVIVCYYDFRMMILCEVAKELDIPVIELQHGVIGKEHISYNFKKKRNLRNFPDYIFTFSQEDKNTTRFPIRDDRIYAVGYPEMENKIKKYEKFSLKKHKKKKILFISQSIKEIFEYAAELSKRVDLEKFEIIVKLHPREFGNWRKEFGSLLNNTTITIIDNIDRDIYFYLAQADYVVGIFSTVLLEATMFDTNIVIIKKASYTYMKKLYENDMAVLIDSVDELHRIVVNNIQTSNSAKTYFEKNSIIKMKSAIQEIIRKDEN
ncbi:MAG: glycosyltransferase family 4 protein [Lachnospiraceae bacterium]|nr:glycosyltransferase family 4 protein [Lachnospiraceae bacterium]